MAKALIIIGTAAFLVLIWAWGYTFAKMEDLSKQPVCDGGVTYSPGE